MALGSMPTHVRNDSVGSGMSRSATLSFSTKRRSVIPMTAEDSVAEFKRDRSNVRPYVRSSKHKLKWTSELHQSFMRAVTQLGGKDAATPKRILQIMDKDGITIAHVKSHLQMYRTGKINAEGLPTTATLSVDSHDPAQLKSLSKEFSGQSTVEDQATTYREVYMALQLLKEGRISGAVGNETLLNIRTFKRLKPTLDKMKQEDLKQEDMKTHEFVPVKVLNNEFRPNSWCAPGLESFLDETKTNNAVDVIDSLSGRKRKAEEDIELDLTMATKSLSPRIQFPSPSTPEEASLSLGLC